MFTEKILDRKRGSPKGVFVVAVFGMVMFLSTLFGHYLLSQIQANAGGLFQYGIISQGARTLQIAGNGGVAFLMFALFGVIMYRAVSISLHPIFLVPGIIAVGVIGFSLSQVANLFWEIINATPEMSASAENFGFMLSFTQNLPKVVMAVAGLVVLIMIGRWRA
jgi:hypothetical protein